MERKKIQLINIFYFHIDFDKILEIRVVIVFDVFHNLEVNENQAYNLFT